MKCITLIVTTAVLATSTACAQTNVPSPYLPTIQPLSERDCAVMMENNTYQPGNPVACKRLSAVHFSYHSDEGIKTEGKLVVLDVVAPEVAILMHELTTKGFYIKKSRPLEEYHGNDIASMADNNTSSFNSRRPATGRNWSLHAYGVAIDINPLQNPVIYPDKREDANGNIVAGVPGTALIRPVNASSSKNNYLNRNIYRARSENDGFYRPGMVEAVADLFADHGFLTWGGYWNDPLDYQHFEVGPQRFIERLYAADPQDSTNPVNGRKLFDQYIDTFKQCLASRKNQASEASSLRASCTRETIQQFSER